MSVALIKQINEILIGSTLEAQIAIIQHFLKGKPELRDAVVVRVFDEPDMNMYGRTITDTVTLASKAGQIRYSLQIHPFPWKPAGATIIPIWRDKDGLPHVLLVHNQRKDKLNKQWRLSEGFMHPKPCQGSNKITLMHPDVMDEAEELILKAKLDAKSAYAKAIAQHPDKIIDINDLTAHDASLEETAKREAREEAGLELKDLALTLLDSTIDASVHNWYLADLSQPQSPYKVTTLPPVLQPDGIEIAEARWVAMADFKFEVVADKIKVLAAGVPVEIKHAFMIGQALTRLYNDEIKRESKNLFSERKNVATFLKYYEYKSNKVAYNELYGHNPGKELYKSLGFASKEDVLAHITNIPGDTQAEKMANWKNLGNISEIAFQQLHKFEKTSPIKEQRASLTR